MHSDPRHDGELARIGMLNKQYARGVVVDTPESDLTLDALYCHLRGVAGVPEEARPLVEGALAAAYLAGYDRARTEAELTVAQLPVATVLCNRCRQPEDVVGGILDGICGNCGDDLRQEALAIAAPQGAERVH